MLCVITESLFLVFLLFYRDVLECQERERESEKMIEGEDKRRKEIKSLLAFPDWLYTEDLFQNLCRLH